MEKRYKQEIEDLRSQLRRLQESERKDKRKLADDDALRKIKRQEDTIAEMTKSLAAQKQVIMCYPEALGTCFILQIIALLRQLMLNMAPQHHITLRFLYKPLA